jgi:dihydroflavonol-4-reductase
MKKVLVTGATGFIGLHCIHQLLNQGYAVNGSLRSPKRKDEIIEALKNKNTPIENLNLFVFNLTEDNGWDEGMQGCDYLLHIASPLSVKAYDDDFFVKPAVAGVKRAFKFAKKHNIKKVVLTSSVAAIIETDEEKEYFDENDWSDIDCREISSYAKSKTMAERAAWDFIKEHQNPFELAVINPALVTGPSLTGDLGESNKAIEMVVTGKMPVAIPMNFGFVDVRDVATAHILAMQNESSNGERFALSEKDLSYKEIAKILRDNGFKKAPRISVPIWIAKFLANFNKELKITVPFMGKTRSLSKTSKAKDVLGWDPRPAEESIIDVANQIREMGLIKN